MPQVDVVQTLDKDPDARLPLEFDWTDFLQRFGTTIVSSTWIVPAGLIKDTETMTATTTRMFISGGLRGKTYTVTNRIAMPEGMTTDRSVAIRIRDR